MPGGSSNRWKYTMNLLDAPRHMMHLFVYTVHLRDTLLRNPVQDGIAQVDAMPCLTDAVDFKYLLASLA